MILVWFNPSSHHAFKQGANFGAHRAKIDVYHHKNGNGKSNNNMDEISQENAAQTKQLVYDNFREQKSPTAQNDDWHPNIHDQSVNKFLEWVEFPFVADRVWRV